MRFIQFTLLALTVSLLGTSAFCEMPKLAYGGTWTLEFDRCMGSALEGWIDELGLYGVRKTVHLSIEKDKTTIVVDSEIIIEGKVTSTCQESQVGKMQENLGLFVFTPNSSSSTCKYSNNAMTPYLNGELSINVDDTGYEMMIVRDQPVPTCPSYVQVYRRGAGS